MNKTRIDIKKYKEQKDYIRNMFQAEKTGEQMMYTDQSKLFKPVIDSQKEIQDKLSTKVTNDALVPFIRELQRREDLSGIETTERLPLDRASTPKEKARQADTLLVDVDKGLLNETHRENLEDMGLDLPSVVQKKGTFKETLDKIESESKSIGQHLGIKSKKTESEKQMYESYKDTLKIYKRVIKALQETQQFIKKTGTGLCRRKRGKGRPKSWKDSIVYSTPDDLAKKLNELIAAKAAGNTGLDNVINSVLDELLRIKVVTKNEYDNLYSSIF